LHALGPAELTVAADDPAGVRGQLLPLEENRQRLLGVPLLSQDLDEVMAEDQRDEPGERRADRRQVADHLPAEARPHRHDAQRIPRALNATPRVDLGQEWLRRHVGTMLPKST
jgi:hypothetical protein